MARTGASERGAMITNVASRAPNASRVRRADFRGVLTLFRQIGGRVDGSTQSRPRIRPQDQPRPGVRAVAAAAELAGSGRARLVVQRRRLGIVAETRRAWPRPAAA